MLSHSESFTVHTSGKGTYEITSQVEKIVREAGIQNGVCTVFIAHTSASLIIYVIRHYLCNINTRINMLFRS